MKLRGTGSEWVNKSTAERKRMRMRKISKKWNEGGHGRWGGFEVISGLSSGLHLGTMRVHVRELRRANTSPF